MSDDDLQKKLDEIRDLVVDFSPHAAALGMRVQRFEPGFCIIEVPYDPTLVGDPDTGVFHGGVASALLDHASGMAAASGMNAEASPATLDLRINYFRAAKPGEALVAEARCLKTTRHVAFVTAIAHDGDPDDPVATAQSSFMIPANAPTTPEHDKPEGGSQ